MSGDFRCACGAWNGMCQCKPGYLDPGGYKPPGLLEATVTLPQAILIHAETMDASARQELANRLLSMNKAQSIRPGLRERLGLWLRERRRANKMSQLKLSELLGYSRPALASYEAGRQSCTMECFVAMCDAFGENPVDAFWRVWDADSGEFERRLSGPNPESSTTGVIE